MEAKSSLALNVIFLCLFIATFVDVQDTSFDAGNGLPVFSSSNISSTTRFLIYDVNPGEGFNLRRDVYVRASNLVRYLNNRGEDWILVLPPWRHMYHWKSRYIHQEALAWKNFFDLANLNYYVPVMEFEDFWKLEGHGGIDHILYLQNHPVGFSNGWKELIEIDKCKERSYYHQDEEGMFRGYFWNLESVFAKKHDCVSVQGHATILAEFLKKLDGKSFFVERFEQVIHIEYGGIDFFKARRSLVFAKHLRIEGDLFREKYLNSTDSVDKTSYNEDWREQVPVDGRAHGGPYIGLHMRRADYTWAHKETIPSIEEIGLEVKKQLKKYKIKKVYVATDGTDKEIEELQSFFKAQIYRYPRTEDMVKKYKDGGVAIIDQWIVSHARYFIGTCESTFSFRIHEERDILGFGADTTYNCICGKQSPDDRCHEPTRWRVKFS